MKINILYKFYIKQSCVWTLCPLPCHLFGDDTMLTAPGVPTKPRATSGLQAVATARL